MAKRVDELDISVRAKNALALRDIVYVFELVQKSEREIMETKNFGHISLKEVKEVLAEAEQKMKKAIEACKREFAEIRTGRASPSLVEGMYVEYYGTPTLLKQIASISIPDARLIVIFSNRFGPFL